ncbi:STRUBBELIG-receptor family 7-like protein isoform X1 [Tanacetum coccineum]
MVACPSTRWKNCYRLVGQGHRDTDKRKALIMMSSVPADYVSAGPSVAADTGKAPMPDLEIPAEFLTEDAQARKRFEEEQASERLVQQLQAEDLVQADLPNVSEERAKELDDLMMRMTETDWLNLMLQVGSNPALAKELLGADVNEGNFIERMLPIMERKKRALADLRYRALKCKPLKKSEVTQLMRNLVKNQWCAAHNGTITMTAVKAMTKQQLIEEYEYICRRLEKDRLLSAQYNLFRPKPVITEPPSKRQRVERASSQPASVPAATTHTADDPDSAGGGTSNPAGSTFGAPVSDSTVPTPAAMDSAGSHHESGVSPFADSADSSSPPNVSTDHIPIDVLLESTSGGINEFFLTSDAEEQIGMSRVAVDPDSDDEVLAEILFRGKYISGAGVVVVDKLPDDEIVDPRVKVETIPESAASPPRSRRKHLGVRSDDFLWDKPVEDFFSSESESDDDMENYIPPLPYGAFKDWEIVLPLLRRRMNSWKLVSQSYVHVTGFIEWEDVYIVCGQVLSYRATAVERMLRHRLTAQPSIVGDVVVDGNVIQDASRLASAILMRSLCICSFLASPEQTATGKDVSNPLYGCDGLPKTVRLLGKVYQIYSYVAAKDWKLLFFDDATSFDSAVHRVHAVSFAAAVLDAAAPVSAACIIAAYFISAATQSSCFAKLYLRCSFLLMALSRSCCSSSSVHADDVSLLLVIVFIGSATTFTNAVTDPSDASALNAMYQNLNSPGQLTKWTSTGGDPCADNWTGVTCSGSRVTQINLAGCGYTGNLPYSISQMTSLKYLNVANNQINGALPDMFGQLSALSTLDISSNSFTGDLPQSFTSLSSATDMYLQNNQFTGTIDVLANLPLKNLNVANNKFTGWIPNRLNNINLQKDGIVISVLVVAALIAFFLIKKRSKKSSTDIEKTDDQFFAPVSPPQHAVQEMKPVQAFPVADTKTFETIDAITLKPPPMDHHKSFDDDGFSAIPIAPKKVLLDVFSVLNLKMESSICSPGRLSDDFIDIVSDVSRLRHPNVYSKPLIWNSRVKIALGTARALEYLHEVCSPSVVHKNIKSANILLDSELNPHLSDSGLSSLVSDTESVALQGWTTQWTYSGPEGFHGGSVTIKSESMVLAVTMLDLLTGRKPFDSCTTAQGRGQNSLWLGGLHLSFMTWTLLQRWLISSRSRARFQSKYHHSHFADVIALCVQAEPEFRPPMSEVVQALVRLVQRANMSKRTVGYRTQSFFRLRSGNQESQESVC